MLGTHATATAPNARTHVSCHCRDSRAFVLVHGDLQLSIAVTVCPNPGMIGHAISACFTRISVEHEALRYFLLAHSPPAKNVTTKYPGKKCVLAEDVRASLTRGCLLNTCFATVCTQAELSSIFYERLCARLRLCLRRFSNIKSRVFFLLDKQISIFDR